MKPITKLYLKTFLLTGVTYGAVVLGFDLIDGNGFSLWKFLIATLFFGVSMSLILVSFHKYWLKKNGVEPITEDDLGVHQSQIIESKFNERELIERLKNNPILGKMKLAELENGISLKTGVTMKSWGEEIKIILKSRKEDKFEYLISSRPKLKTTLVDYGKNMENINLIEKVIKTMA